jgi:hypothetical protein
MNIKMTGNDQMAAMMAKMGGMTMISTVQSIETGTIPADMFAPPAGYKIVEKK